MSAVIRVENVGKQYRLGEVGTGTLSHDLNRLWARLRGKDDPFLKIGDSNDRTKKGESDYVWALKDINFDIQQGDAVGIIGRNGAGKSTLLKLLSRTTLPTTGSIKVKGRIASLLEVGTGFMPEMTGRENIYQNGALLGMRKAEITRKLDEIIDFSGCERYIDTPVKRYSSGMYVRLAFAVAAHLEAEILVVDEVLAVGDAEFQKKCLGKMNDISKGEGRTVLFVSHQMGAVAQLCSKGILLKNGKIGFNGNINDCIDKYLTGSDQAVAYKAEKTEAKVSYIREAYISNQKNESGNVFLDSDTIKLRFTVTNKAKISSARLSCTIQSKVGEFLSTFVEDLSELGKNTEGDHVFEVCYPGHLIVPNLYAFRLAIFIPNDAVYDLVDMICPFQIVDGGSNMSIFEGLNYGYFKTNHIFTCL